MPGAGCTHGPLCNRKAQGQEPQVHRMRPGIPCAMVLRLIRDLPGDHRLVATVVRRDKSRDLSACFGAPGPHDFAVREQAAFVLRCRRVHRIPAPRVVTTARTPLSIRRDGEMKHLIWGKDKAKYFCGEDWTTQISLNRLRKFDFSRKRFCRLFWRGKWSDIRTGRLPANRSCAATELKRHLFGHAVSPRANKMSLKFSPEVIAIDSGVDELLPCSRRFPFGGSKGNAVREISRCRGCPRNCKR
jgi:hypothetical protein